MYYVFFRYSTTLNGQQLKSSRSFEEGSRSSNHVTSRSNFETPFQLSPANSLESSFNQPSNDSSIEQRSPSAKCGQEIFQEDRMPCPENTIGHLEPPVQGQSYVSSSGQKVIAQAPPIQRDFKA